MLARVCQRRKAGFHVAEFDVTTSKDNYIVVMHDDTLTRTTDVAEVRKVLGDRVPSTDFVYDWTLAQLRLLKLVPGNETVPTLREYLTHIKSIGIMAQVELKASNDPHFVQRALDIICETGMEERTFLAASDIRYQYQLLQLQPFVPIEKDVLFHPQSNWFGSPLNVDIVGINGEILLFNPYIVSQVHSNGQHLLVYFISSLESAWIVKFYRYLGADIIMLDSPQVCVDAGLCPGDPNVTLTKYWTPSEK